MAPNITYIWEVLAKWLTANLSTIPKVQLFGKATAEADTAILVDSDGHLQIDSLTSGLPTGAATEATLAAIKTAVELIDNMISGSEGQVDIVAALPAGSNTIGNVGLAPQTSGGLSIFRSLDLDTIDEAVKASPGQLFGFVIHNNHATDTRFVKFYDEVVASVTVGTTTPVMTIPISAGQIAAVEFTNGIVFSTAITIAATTAALDNSVGAPGANEVVGNIFYK